MLNQKNGVIKINDQLVIDSEYTFEQFRKTQFYKKQDGIRIIDLDEPQTIEGDSYIVSLFFRNGKIYMVSLINCDEDLTQENEFLRKKVHDKILLQKGILSGQEYVWGKVTSEYDPRGNVSSINIVYN